MFGPIQKRIEIERKLEVATRNLNYVNEKFSRKLWLYFA